MAVPTVAAGATSNVSLARLLVRFFHQPSPASARAFLSSSRSCTRAQRRKLAALACLEEAWRNCDQSIAENVSDLVSAIVAELYEPFWFFRSTLFGDGEVEDRGRRRQTPCALFSRQLATPPLVRSKRDKFWTAPTGTARYEWLPSLETTSEADGATGKATFDAVVHFVQAGSGTGVHIGDGRVLTCAHVIEGRDDDALDEVEVPDRLRRGKLVMFASGRTFIAECTNVLETSDGSKDVALMMLGAELDVSSLPVSNTARAAVRGTGAAASGASGLPAAEIANKAVSLGDSLFCVGNPSNVDLESLTQGGIEFEPPTWHTSVGKCEGYLDPVVEKARAMQQARGRPPTRGELKSVMEAVPVDAQKGTCLQHSCWTYWGHSGAPLFNEDGQVCSLHCAWDDKTGMRHGQKLQHLLDVIAKGVEPVTSSSTNDVRAKDVEGRGSNTHAAEDTRARKNKKRRKVKTSQ
uniref:Serine protease n=1 Tax=Odontella aurita TaxID=265563 RepID=A0A6U6CCM1_9STRA|mmetsp:Transcript_10667/g.31537  ORF Transcript_10667/g.31537 Transcript_10667/m.31537 type:complete len:465 (+) Transcript_10667:126-1520(+)